MQECLEFELSIARKYGISVRIKDQMDTVCIDRTLLSSVRSLRNHRIPLGSFGLSHLSSRSTCQFLSMLKIGKHDLSLPLTGLTISSALSDMLSSYRGPNSRTSIDGNAPEQLGATVLPSSTELFYFYAQTLDQCSKFTTGPALYDLVQVFKKWLRIYAGEFFVCALDYLTSIGR